MSLYKKYRIINRGAKETKIVLFVTDKKNIQKNHQQSVWIIYWLFINYWLLINTKYLLILRIVIWFIKIISFPSPIKPIKIYTNIEPPKTRNGATMFLLEVKES